MSQSIFGSRSHEKRARFNYSFLSMQTMWKNRSAHALLATDQSNFACFKLLPRIEIRVNLLYDDSFTIKYAFILRDRCDSFHLDQYFILSIGAIFICVDSILNPNWNRSIRTIRCNTSAPLSHRVALPSYWANGTVPGWIQD